jgi:DNA polymerase-3 subunit delta'
MNIIYPWQQTQWSQIESLLAQNRLPHALLLSGSKNIGKRTFAMVLAQRLLCNHPGSTACGACQGCHLMQSANHPDFHLLEPMEKAKVIKIEQVRERVAALSQTSQQGGAQVVLLCPAEDMNVAAANALLKTLEEPQGQVFFLLVSHQPSSLPATIRSRCQSIAFPVPDPAITTTWLATQSISQTSSSELLLKLADNVPLTAMLFVEEERLKTHQKILEHFVDIRLNALSPLQAATALSDVLAEHVFTTLWSVLMDLVRLAAHQSELRICNIQYLDKFKGVSQHIQQRALFAFLDELMAFKGKIDSKIALNQQLLLEDLFIKWRTI